MSYALELPEMPPLFGSARDWSRELLLSLAAGTFLGLTGPFGSYRNTSHLGVLAYWVGTTLYGALLLGLTVRPAIGLGRRRGFPPWGTFGPSLLLAAIPLSLGCHVIAARLWPQSVARIGLLGWYGQTLVISLPLALGYLAGTRPGTVSAPRPTPVPDATAGPKSRCAIAPAFWQRLPPDLDRDLVALQMEDHYVRVHTANGSALVLLPLRQAVAELPPSLGMQTHRSWWVCHHAVTGTVRDGRNLRLRLKTGVEAPISRNNIASVRAAGLLAPERP